MKRCLTCFCAILSLGGAAAQDDSFLPFSKEDIHALIRETAVKIEEKYQGKHEEADGLARRVEEMLTTPMPPAVDETDPQKKLVKEMGLMAVGSMIATGTPSIRGLTDSSPAGRRQRYERLENGSATDGEEVRRWLEMRELAKRLKWEDKEQLCRRHAGETARALVSREPKNAEARALLAAALDWDVEKKQVLESALKIDPGQPLARQMLLRRRVATTLESAALRREIPLESKEEPNIMRALYDRPLTEQETRAFEERLDSLRREAERVRALAYERGDMAAHLNTLADLNWIDTHTSLIESMTHRDPGESYEAFEMSRLFLYAGAFFAVKDERQLREALELAQDDPETTGIILAFALAGGLIQTAVSQQAPQSLLELVGGHFARLVAMAGEDDSLRAARAAEAVVMVEIAMMGALRREPFHLELLPRAIRLDPFRYRTLDLLIGLYGMMGDRHTAGAVAHLQLALAPSLEVRRICAAVAAIMDDWDTAHRHLDACFQEKPDDVMLLNQKAVTLLQEGLSDAALEQAAAIYDPIIAKLKPHLRELRDKGEREILIRNCVLFLALRGKDAEAEAILKSASKEKLITEEEIKKIREALRLRPSA